jgi:hypothetical protein
VPEAAGQRELMSQAAEVFLKSSSLERETPPIENRWTTSGASGWRCRRLCASGSPETTSLESCRNRKRALTEKERKRQRRGKRARGVES